MTSSPWLLLDVSCLAFRSLYSTGDLTFGGIGTGVTYGLIRAVLDIQDTHASNRPVWCFDRGHSKRSDLDQRYKENRRRDMDDDLKEAHRELRQQLYRMRTDYLPRLGFQNILWRDDYEADDVIASVCENLPRNDRAVIVSTDNDLLQLLVPGRISCWNPITEKPTTAESFSEKWGISPTQWADVKAIAGCSSDNVVGISGVGEKTAVKFLRGELKDTTKAHQSIVAGNDVWKKNLQLVQLPFPGVGQFDLVEDRLDEDAWDELKSELGFRSLHDRRLNRRIG